MKFIIITSIFEPTEAVIEFSKLSEYKLIVAGDKKSPHNWQCNNVTFLSVDDQEGLDFSLSKVLPYNHYCRKMIGYLYAIQNGASMIIDTDDDNIPKQNWKFPDFNGKFDCIPGDKGFINIYQHYTDDHIWPRGLPLNKITTQYHDVFSAISEKNVNIGIWQGLADEDPDVDAIYRLTSNKLCKFREKEPCVIEQGTLTPFNTQNTAIRKELFPLMYLPTYVTFRFTDILRGLIAQPIMWLYGYHLGFINATVVQKRNPHDFMVDFESELPMYKYTEKVIELVSASIHSNQSISDNLYNSYDALLKNDIVTDKEMKTLSAWLKDIDKLTTR
jgi:hypothetical protein